MIITDKKKNIFIDKARATKKKRFTTEVHGVAYGYKQTKDKQ